MLELEDAVDLCRSYRDRGYKTNGQMRVFYRNKEIDQLYKKVLSNRANNKPVSILADMSRYNFWPAFGTRINHPETCEWIEQLIQMRDNETT